MGKHSKTKIQLFKSRKSFIMMTIVLIIILFLGVMSGTYIYRANGNIQNAALDMMADIIGTDEPISVLILGVSEDIDTALTDTMMLASYNPKTQNAFVISIPRDTYIGKNKAKANGFDKINALYSINPKKTVSAVESLTGIKIDNYGVVKNSVLVDLVDAIGGVEFDVPINMKYDDDTQDLHIDLKKGVQILSGDQAEQLVRFRHSNPDANGKMTTYPSSYGADDYGRMRTQREFMKATATQLASWKNVGKLKDITEAVFNNLETDMRLTQIISYIPSMLKLNTETLRMEQLPGVSDQINEIWFYLANTDDTCELVNELMLSLQLDEAELAKMYTPIKDMPIVADNKEIAGTANNKNEVK